MSVKKYALFDTVLESMECGCYMSLKEWKRVVRDRVLGLEKRVLKIRCKTFKSLIMLDTSILSTSSWWYHSYRYPRFLKNSRSIIRLLLNVNRRGKEKCIYCYGKVNDISHILFECNSNVTQREMLWKNVLNSCPGKLSDSLQIMNAKEKCKMILNCFNVKYENEWKNLYNQTSNFICSLVSDYDKVVNVG